MRRDVVALTDSSLQAGFDIPNPNTPLAFLPPRDASAHEFLRNFWVAIAAVWTWDLVCSLSEEYRLLTGFRVSITQIFYILARLCAAACVYMAVIFAVAHVDNCNALFIATNVLLSSAPLFSSFLMFLRVRAVYLDHPRLVSSFFLFWLLCSASLFGSTIPAFHAMHIGPTRSCVIDRVDSVAGVGVILNALSDTVFFLAISYRLLHMHQYGDTWKMRLRSFFGGNEPHLSGVRRRGLTHALLRAGQQYYLLTVWMSVATAVVPFLTHIPLDYRVMFGPPYVALQNIMMCRVYRQLKLGLIVDYDLDRLDLDPGPGSSSSRAAPLSSPPAGDGQDARQRIETTGDMESGCRNRAQISDATSETALERP
ncbi:hypothetical protein PsYK624_167690 [Phanerochaete sordida]|uniref:Uncharacterized protein n=1 Tax=Phanerochaete sordida TaxID=48140 RepID=A0A9P3LMJ2_9APHY|nr:hypothetical protein PsYK624_167690 [Phanerochaete sordida]